MTHNKSTYENDTSQTSYITYNLFAHNSIRLKTLYVYILSEAYEPPKVGPGLQLLIKEGCRGMWKLSQTHITVATHVHTYSTHVYMYWEVTARIILGTAGFGGLDANYNLVLLANTKPAGHCMGQGTITFAAIVTLQFLLVSLVFIVDTSSQDY